MVVVLADDLGWNEVSWHNPAVLTPHMEVRWLVADG
jgi:arylsulfatase A-like enzyme